MNDVCAKTLHKIALLAQERADALRTDITDADSIYDRIRTQGMIDALDDFAESLWLRAGDA